MTKQINKKVYAILDYDGFVCKSFYANKENPMDVQEARNILLDLTASAREKASEYFQVPIMNIKLIPIMSGHSWKKDIYPSYKRTRKKNEYLGVYRDIIKSEIADIIVIPNLEADEAIVASVDWLRTNNKDYVVFSDDKDLRYYSETYCKINITEQIQEQDMLDIWRYQLEQMLIGDREDNITGIPKVGDKTAPKLLEQYGYSIEGVINCYKDRDIDIDNCLRDLLLIIPMSQDYLEKKELGQEVGRQVIANNKVNDLDVYKAIESQVRFLNDKVKEIYDKKN